MSFTIKTLNSQLYDSNAPEIKLVKTEQIIEFKKHHFKEFLNQKNNKMNLFF
jgi:hypothetical protein